MARTQVDNREPAHPERESGLDMVAFIIRTAMLDHIAHLLDDKGGFFGRPRPIPSHESCNSTHRSVMNRQLQRS